MIALVFALVTIARAGILFIDLNNAPQEYGACMDAAGDGNVTVVSQATNEDGAKISAANIESTIRELEAVGNPPTSVILSCHQGGGTCFGEGGQITAAQLSQILARNRETSASVNTIGMINCYGANVESSQLEWLLPNPNVQQVFGFPGQGPKKTTKDSPTLVADYCKNNQRYARASNKRELCELYPRIASLTKQSVALCSREAIAAAAYGAQTCYTYDELKARCSEFDPGEKMLVNYLSYLNPDDPCGPYANPPTDKNSAYEGGASQLRRYYNQVHLWRQCADQIFAERGYDLPEASQQIRLIKYDTIKTNLARLNKAELADYDRRLDQLCLGEYKLGDITKLTRARLNERIEAAVRVLGGGERKTPMVSQISADADAGREPAAVGLARGQATCRPFAPTRTHPCSGTHTDPRVVARMAGLLRETFVDLSDVSTTYRPNRGCVPFTLVEDDAEYDDRSRCIVDYKTAAAL